MNRPRLKKLLQNLALASGSFALCFVVLEVALRIAGYGNVEIYAPDPVLFWRLKPNQNCFTKVDRKPVHMNSLGTRVPEFQPVKPPGTLRILSLGDSKTYNWGLSEAETYSVRIGKMLQERLGPAAKVEVINAGVNACYIPTTHQLLAAEPSDVLKAKTLVSRRLNVPLVDMTPDLAPKVKELFLEGDQAHLSAAGNELVSQRLFPTLIRLISHEQA